MYCIRYLTRMEEPDCENIKSDDVELNTVEAILRGNFDQLPKEKPNEIRIFFSSTFSGLNLYIN